MIGKNSATSAGESLREAAPAHVPATAGRVADGSGCAVEWVETLDDLNALEADWLRLEQAGSRANSVFQSFAWCSSWAQIYLQGDHGISLQTVVVRENGAVALIWPLMRTRHGPFTLLTWLSYPAALYGDVVLDDTRDPTRLLEAAWAEILTHTDADGVVLHYVREDGNAYRFLKNVCRALPDGHLAPQLDLSAFESADAYTAALSGNQRKQRAKLRRKLEQAGELRFDTHSHGEAFETAARRAIALKKEWLDRQGLKPGTIGDPRIVELLIALSRRPDPIVTANVLSLDGAPLTIDVSYRYNGHYLGCVIAEDAAAGSKSPAKVHFDLLQKACIENGDVVFDMMIPDSSFKRHWTNDSVAASDFVQPLNAWGYVYCGLYLRHARPAIKRLYYALGPTLRTPVVRLLTTLGLVS